MSQTRRPQHPNAALTPGSAAQDGPPRCRGRLGAWPLRRSGSRSTTRRRASGAAATGPRAKRASRTAPAGPAPARGARPSRCAVVWSSCDAHSRRGAGFIAHVCGMHASTVHRICVAEGLGRLGRGDRSCGPPSKPLRYQRENPGELVHLDVKKLPAIPDGGGWRTHGRGNAGPRQRAGWRYVHSAIDDRTRLGYSEIHTNETGPTAAGVLATSRGLLRPRGDRLRKSPHRQWPLLPLQRLPAGRSKTPAPAHGAPAPTGPKPTGKSERFHRILNEEWAYARDWDSDTQRSEAHQHFHAPLQ